MVIAAHSGVRGHETLDLPAELWIDSGGSVVYAKITTDKSKAMLAAASSRSRVPSS